MSPSNQVGEWPVKRMIEAQKRKALQPSFENEVLVQVSREDFVVMIDSCCGVFYDSAVSDIDSLHWDGYQTIFGT
jgi:hypothetical protein